MPRLTRLGAWDHFWLIVDSLGIPGMNSLGREAEKAEELLAAIEEFQGTEPTIQQIELLQHAIEGCVRAMKR